MYLGFRRSLNKAGHLKASPWVWSHDFFPPPYFQQFNDVIGLSIARTINKLAIASEYHVSVAE